MLIVTKALVASGVAALAMNGTPLPDSARGNQVAAQTPILAGHSAPHHCPGSCNLWGMIGPR